MEFEYTGPATKGFADALMQAFKMVPDNAEYIDHFTMFDASNITIYLFCAEIVE